MSCRNFKDSVAFLKEQGRTIAEISEILSKPRSSVKWHFCGEKKERRQERVLKNKEIIADYKRGLGCSRCGENDPRVLQFHHTDPSEKDQDISTLSRRYSIDRVFEEIKKCEVICANCHIKLHEEE